MNFKHALKTPENLTAAVPERLPKSSEKFRILKTENGEVKITRLDGYRILYNNHRQAPFVNMKVELSERKAYLHDQKNILENLKFMNANSPGMETKNLIELEFNKYKVFGLSRGTIESGSTLGTFVLFPEDGITVYFYFNNLKPGYNSFENLEEYKIQRDRFMNEYTLHLTTCNKK